jgi:TPR repeat protein
MLYDKGFGVTQDRAKAQSILEKACDARNEPACVTLGGKHLGQALASTTDDERAIQLFVNACAKREDQAAWG